MRVCMCAFTNAYNIRTEPFCFFFLFFVSIIAFIKFTQVQILYSDSKKNCSGATLRSEVGCPETTLILTTCDQANKQVIYLVLDSQKFLKKVLILEAT